MWYHPVLPHRPTRLDKPNTLFISLLTCFVCWQLRRSSLPSNATLQVQASTASRLQCRQPMFGGCFQWVAWQLCSCWRVLLWTRNMNETKSGINTFVHSCKDCRVTRLQEFGISMDSRFQDFKTPRFQLGVRRRFIISKECIIMGDFKIVADPTLQPVRVQMVLILSC